ncbi:MAG: hypothetical protein M1409_06300 [Actinobacteria bacterium]|nr:hypothetical protein [Actinomycetota bacterium]
MVGEVKRPDGINMRMEFRNNEDNKAKSNLLIYLIGLLNKNYNEPIIDVVHSDLPEFLNTKHERPALFNYSLAIGLMTLFCNINAFFPLDDLLLRRDLTRDDIEIDQNGHGIRCVIGKLGNGNQNPNKYWKVKDNGLVIKTEPFSNSPHYERNKR